MPLTNFPNGITSMGVPLVGGVNGIPLTGNWYFVNETTGSDGNPGTAQAPLATLGQAQTLATANQNDVVCFQGSIHLSSTLTWAKNQVHLIGMCEPLVRGKRARISVTGSTAFSPMVSVTASGCWFANFGTFYGFNSASNNAICWQDTGGRSCYDTVEFLGFGDGTASTGTANITGARAFKMSTSTGESTFRNCVFGVDTIVRNATNYTVEIAGGAPRIHFEDCIFEADLGSSGTASSHVVIGADGIDRYIKFKRCEFFNSVDSGASAMAQVFNINSAPGGTVLLDQSVFTGATAWQTSPVSAFLMNMTLATTGGGKAHLVF
jgi:hypothetical protein